MNPKRLFLIDGMSHIYRAYYAIRNLSNTKGLPTNAVYGFTSMLRKLIQEQKPEYIGVALDLEGPTVRHEKYQDYKATRKPMPPDLVQQIPYIRKVCEAFRVPVIGHAGFEADDVIGTLSLKATEQGLQSIIVTSDKDMLQLVSDHVLVLDAMKDNTILDSAEGSGEDGCQTGSGGRPARIMGRYFRQHSRSARNRRKGRERADPDIRHSGKAPCRIGIRSRGKPTRKAFATTPN